MADPLSIAAGIIGIAATTAHTARRLKEVLDSIKESPETVRSVAKELGILQCSLVALWELLSGDDDFSEVAQTDEGVRCIISLTTILTHCQQDLASIHLTVRPFIEKRNGSREHIWKTMAGWANRKDTLESMKRELINAKMTLDLGITFATFLLTRAGISHLQTQFTQLNTRMEQEASEDNMSDIGSSSVVTDLGFTIRKFLREPDTTAIFSNSFIAANDKRPAKDIIDTEFGWHSRRTTGDIAFVSNVDNGSRPKTGYSFDSIEVYPNASSPPDSPLTKRTTFSSLEPYSPTRPVTRFNTSFSQPTEQYGKKPNVERQITNTSQTQSTSIHYARPAERPSLKPALSSLSHNDGGWEDFQIPLKVFSNYFKLPYKKRMQKSPTSMLNFGIVTAQPISNSPAYADNHTDDGRGSPWDHINDPKLYRRSAPHWTLRIPSHKVSGKPPTKGVTGVSLSKVITGGSSYEFIRLFIVAQKPQNMTAYNFQWQPFCVFTYISHPRRIRDIGVDDESTDNVAQTIPDATPVSVWLEIKDEMLTFRLKSSDDKNFLNPFYAYWSMDPNLETD